MHQCLFSTKWWGNSTYRYLVYAIYPLFPTALLGELGASHRADVVSRRTRSSGALREPP